MTEIDLHGFKHDEVEDKLANLLILHYNMGNFPIKIITGKSDKMKTIVRDIVDMNTDLQKMTFGTIIQE